MSRTDGRKKAVCRHCGATVRRETARLPWAHTPPHLDRDHTAEPFPHERTPAMRTEDEILKTIDPDGNAFVGDIDCPVHGRADALLIVNQGGHDRTDACIPCVAELHLAAQAHDPDPAAAKAGDPPFETLILIRDAALAWRAAERGRLLTLIYLLEARLGRWRESNKAGVSENFTPQIEAAREQLAALEANAASALSWFVGRSGIDVDRGGNKLIG